MRVVDGTGQAGSHGTRLTDGSGVWMGLRNAKPRMPTLLPTSDPHSSLAMGNNATALPHVDAVDLAQKIERLTDGQFVSPSYQRAYVLREAPL